MGIYILADAASPGLWSYFMESNLAGQAIVLVLIGFSLAAWTIMIGKYLDLSNLNQANHHFERKLKQAGPILTCDQLANRQAYVPYAKLVAEAIRSLETTANISGLDEASLITKRLNHIDNALQRVIGAQFIAYESKMLFLGTIISGAPFLGLLGTAWGVMDAFGAVSMHSNVSLQMLAPGVSGSLLTTVAALLVAIPSVFGYNYLMAHIKAMQTQLDNFSSALLDRMELELEQAQTPALR